MTPVRAAYKGVLIGNMGYDAKRTGAPLNAPDPKGYAYYPKME
jgi:hypothetical protein